MISTAWSPIAFSSDFFFYDLPSPFLLCVRLFWLDFDSEHEIIAAKIPSLVFLALFTNKLCNELRWDESPRMREISKARLRWLRSLSFKTLFYLASREYLEMRRRRPAAATPLAQMNSLRCVNLLRFAMFFPLLWFAYGKIFYVLSILSLATMCAAFYESD